MFGKGKYDEQCLKVMQETGAHTVFMVILGGDKGSGIPCKASYEGILDLPEILRKTADAMEKDAGTLHN